jgi:amino-acid N-acetyltransferase
VAQHLHEFLVVEDVGHFIAAAGLERYGTAALLRSVAVRPEHRSRGVARTLVGQLLSHARSSGVREVYLLTTSAQPYFRRLGFQVVPREAIDPAVAMSAEFGESCCATAVAMRLELRDGGPR